MYHHQSIGKAARAAFEGCTAGTAHIYIPAVVISEMIMVVERNRIPALTMAQCIADLEKLRLDPGYTLLSLEPERIIASHTLTAIPDIFDRLIVAEARHRNVPLITRDTLIVAAGVVETVWD